ncbi:MAG: tail protein X [Selenomonadaceae bacterium]|nr:tail protein X [Selenomonadaceae bacterium]
MQTKQGDTWDLIAWRELGDVRHVEALINANRALIETQIFEAGVEINLPTVEPIAKEVLPPWKR